MRFHKVWATISYVPVRPWSYKHKVCVFFVFYYWCKVQTQKYKQIQYIKSNNQICLTLPEAQIKFSSSSILELLIAYLFIFKCSIEVFQFNSKAVEAEFRSNPFWFVNVELSEYDEEMHNIVKIVRTMKYKI